VSTDRGRTWKQSELRVPIGAIPTTKTPMPEGAVCFDTTATVAADGTFYVTAGISSPYDYGRKQGHSGDREFQGVFRSTDGGKNWTLFEAMAGAAVVPGSALDQSTGALYSLNLQSKLAVSIDRAQTFSTPRMVMPAIEQAHVGVGGNWVSAARGLVGVVYLVTMGKGQPGGWVLAGYPACPCKVYVAISADRGETFSYHEVPVSDGVGQLTGWASLPHVAIAADPSRKGRFAVAFTNTKNTELDVLVSNDSGKTWSKPARLSNAGAPINRFMIKYGPQGVLGAAWRVNHDDKVPANQRVPHDGGDFPPGPQDIFAAVAFGGETSFTSPLKVNANPSPWLTLGKGGDEWTGLAVDNDAVHVAWGDYREIDQSVWYAQIPLEAFRRFRK